MNAYEEAKNELFQAAFGDFVAERKRLAAELKGAGDKEAAARLSKLPRPPVSAWAVNQLWWRERMTFDELLGAAARLREGDRAAGPAHRHALAILREAAANILQGSGNAASDATLRRVQTTLSAVAAAGSFEPDSAGALTQDRDPPGFEVMSSSGATATPGAGAEAQPQERAAETERQRAAETERQRAAETERQRAAETERQRAAETERQRRLAERERLSALQRDAAQLRDSQLREVESRRSALASAEQDLQRTKTLLAEIEAQLASL